MDFLLAHLLRPGSFYYSQCSSRHRLCLFLSALRLPLRVGDTTLTGPTPINIVHIANLGYAVSDLSVMGANNARGSTGTVAIQDELTGTQIKDTSVSIYALGESADGGYSRYTTSPNAASWAVRTTSPSTSGACSRGSLYSCIGAVAVLRADRFPMRFGRAC
jgi:hypothetical protein